MEMQDMKAKLEVVDSDSRLRLEQELASLGRQMVDYQADSRSAVARLRLQIQALEVQNAKVTALVEMYTTVPFINPVFCSCCLPT